MTQRLVFALAALGVLMFGGGCSAVIAWVPTTLGHDAPPEYAFRTAHEQVEAKLGKPLEVTALPDGGQVAMYQYRMREREISDLGKDVIMAEVASLFVPQAGGLLWLVLQPAFISTAAGAAIYQVAHPQYGTVTFTFGPYGELLHTDAPPSYGPADDPLEQPSIGALRRSCWTGAESQPPGPRKPERDERAYVECVARRFAHWGIE